MAEGKIKLFESHLHQAARQPVGLLIRSPDPVKDRQNYYFAKHKAQNPGLADIICQLVNKDGGNLVLIKKSLLEQGEPKPDVPATAGGPSLPRVEDLFE